MVGFAVAAVPPCLLGDDDRQQLHAPGFFALRRRRNRIQYPFASVNAHAVFSLAEASGNDAISNVSLRRLLKPNYSDIPHNGKLVALPIGTRKGNKRRRYVWDGERITLVNEDLLEQGYSHADQLQDHMSKFTEGVWNAFFPDPRDVVPSYWAWLPWRLSHRFFSSMMQNFATQSLLSAVGIGAKKALAASAAINWMLKDGLGRIARMTVATQFAHTFDSDLKRVRFCTALLFTASMSAEFMAPFAPQHFLLLASLANVGKAVGLTTFISTQPAFQQALCTSTNLADISAKTQAQHMVVDTLALAVSAALTWAVRNSPRGRMLLPLGVFAATAAGDLISIHQELKAVVLRTLNRERAEMVGEQWVAERAVPTPAEISGREHLLGPPNISGGLLPMRVRPLERMVASPTALNHLLRDYQDRPYMLTYFPASHPLNCPSLPWQQPQPEIAAAVSDAANPRDLLEMALETAHLRHSLRNLAELHLPPSTPSTPRSVEEVLRVGAVPPAEVARAARAARKWAAAELDRFQKALEGQGWRTTKFLLSSAERCGYQLLSEPT